MNKSRLLQKYLLSDMAVSLIVWVLFTIFRKTVNDAQIFENVRMFVPNYDYFSSLLLFPLSCATVHYLSGFYLHPYKQSKLTIFLTTFIATFIISIIIFFVLLLNDIVVSYAYYYYSLIVLFLMLFVFTYSFRLIISSQVRFNYRTKKWTVNTLIIGTGTNALKIANEIEKNEERNTLIGYVSVGHHTVVPADKVLGTLSQAGVLIPNFHIEEVIVALDSVDELQLFPIINSLYKYDIDILFTPRLFEILTGGARINRLDMSPLVSITSTSMSDWEAAVKRFLDIFISLLSLLIISPFLLYCVIKIKSDSTGPVFYRQDRIGLYGRTFKILKFRTMNIGAENGMPKLSSPNDERITTFGKFLRKYRIDEIPQFWNILKGDMSLVGPRPERRYYINQIIEQAPYYCLLYKIRPGLTSWGPIKIGYADTIEKMIERLNYDLIYMDNMSLLNDFKIMIYTIEIIFKGKGM